jgi:hypothetical protein
MDLPVPPEEDEQLQRLRLWMLAVGWQKDLQKEEVCGR